MVMPGKYTMIRLYENFRAVLYVPFYLAHALGAYDDEGVEVLMSTSPAPAESAQGVLSGRVEVAWGGPMRVMYHHATDPECDLVSFCEVVTRDPFCLVGGSENPDFALAQLPRYRSSVAADLPTPWLCLQEDVRQAGEDPAGLTPDTTRTMEENVQALRAGETDVVQLFEPHVEALLREGAGHIWYAAASRGHTAYTALHTTRLLLRTREEELLRMTRAIHRTLRWLHDHEAEEVAEAASDFFPELERDLLEGAVRRYKHLEVWGQDAVLPREGYDRLKRAMLSGGFIWKDIPFEQCVSTRLAEQVLAENPPPL
jgi:NitT/TauT family transport system substrate-binding protein